MMHGRKNIKPQTHFMLGTNIGAETCSTWYLICGILIVLNWGSLVGCNIENKATFHLRVQYCMAFIAPMCAQLILGRRSPTPNFTKIGQEVWHVRSDVHWGPSVRHVGTNSGLLDMCSCTSGVPCVLRHGRTDAGST
jgi:hypothetical protein